MRTKFFWKITENFFIVPLCILDNVDEDDNTDEDDSTDEEDNTDEDGDTGEEDSVDEDYDVSQHVSTGSTDHHFADENDNVLALARSDLNAIGLVDEEWPGQKKHKNDEIFDPGMS